MFNLLAIDIMYFMMSIDCEMTQFAVEDEVIAQFDTYFVSN